MDSDTLKIILLAIVQGVTEFLPISSSGHLVIFQSLIDFNEHKLQYAIVLHAGTLLSIIVFYFNDLIDLLKIEKRRIILLVGLGTAPLIPIGYLIKPIMDVHFGAPWLTAAGLLGSAVLLLFLYRQPSEPRTLSKMHWREAIWIGLIQCVAIIPGVSRSGSTIALATRLGFGQEYAARFSFFLAIPAILGASASECIDIYKQSQGAGAGSVDPHLAIIGFVVSFVIGLLALKVLIHTLKSGIFSYFGYYCLAASVLLAFVLMRS